MLHYNLEDDLDPDPEEDDDDDDEDFDGDDDDLDDEGGDDDDDPETWQVASGGSPVPLKARLSLTSGTVLPRLAGIFQLS